MTCVRAMAFLLALLLGATVAAGAAEPVPTPKMIFFASGSTRGTVGGHVLRGNRDLYSVKATVGRIMTVTITAPDDNAVFQIYEPGTHADAPRHTHTLDFQFIYVLKGWAIFEYEGYGEHKLVAGSTVYQPPGIRHKEIAHSDDFEVLEITMPAQFETRTAE